MPSKGRRLKLLAGRETAPCEYCGKTFAWFQLTVDHVMPRSKGGSNRPDNLVLSCGPCNHAKADKLVFKLGHREIKVLKNPAEPTPYDPDLARKVDAAIAALLVSVRPRRKKRDLSAHRKRTARKDQHRTTETPEGYVPPWSPLLKRYKS